LPLRSWRAIREKAVSLVIVRNPDKIKYDNLKNSQVGMLEKHGVTSSFSLKEVQEQIILEHRRRQGFDYPAQREEVKEKKKEKSLEKFGTTCTLHAPEIRKKVENTFKEKFGTTHPMKNKDVLLKATATNQKRYGKDNPAQSEEVIEKIHQTKLDNGSYGKSQPEDDLHDLIFDEINPQVERQYREDPRYPFACDFYLKETECFIELQGDTFRHLSEPYKWK